MDKGKSQIHWDDQHQLVRAQTIGKLDEESASWITNETEKMAKLRGDNIDWLIDLTQMTEATSKARKKMVQATAHPSIRSYAIFGASIFVRTVANFILAASGQHNARHFSDEASALKWIEDNRR